VRVLAQVTFHARPIGLRYQVPQHRPVVDSGHGREQHLHDLGIGIHEPGCDLGREDALQHQETKGLVAGMAALAPAQEVVLHTVFRRPIGEGPEQWAPDGAALPVRYREIRDRLAGIVAQTSEARRQTPARLELPTLGGTSVEGKDPALARLGGMKSDLQAVTEQATRAAVVVCLRGREQVNEGSVMLDDRSYQRFKTCVREGQAVLQPRDQLALGATMRSGAATASSQGWATPPRAERA
jgi:hypothetical protein